MATETDVRTVAMTLYGEARGQSLMDRLGVGAVIRERKARPGWWSRPTHTWTDVCKYPWQFAAWSDHDESHRRNKEAMLRAVRDDPAVWAGLFHLANYVIHHMTDRDVTRLFDVTGPDEFPTHFVDRSMTGPPASWGDEVQEIRPLWGRSDFRWYVVRKGRPPRRGEV